MLVHTRRYEERSKLFAKIPNFWMQTLLNHPLISQMVTDDDMKVLEYLTSVSGVRGVCGLWSVACADTRWCVLARGNDTLVVTPVLDHPCVHTTRC